MFERQNKRKVLAVGASVVLIGSLGVVGILRQRIKASNQQANVPVRFALKKSDPLHPETAQKQLKARIAKARNLRQKWKPWALKHKRLLQQMRSAQAGNHATLNAVWKSIPGFWNEAGINDQDMGATASIAQLAQGVPVMSWQASENGETEVPPDLREQHEEMQRALDKARLETFDKHRDIILSESVGPGPFTVHLWVSGRLTQTAWVPQNIAGQPGLTLGEHEEIAPHYDFLS